MTSVSNSRRPRLKRTLKRKPEYRAFQEDDVKYLWAAYRQGAFAFPEGLSPADFRDQVVQFILDRYVNAWILGDIGIIFGIQAGPRVLIGDAQWFPWAKKRQIVEHFIGFLNGLRKDVNYIGECTFEDKRFFDYAAQHGILRRVGTFYNPERTAVYESKPWEK